MESINQTSNYTAADALTDALVSAGVTHVFLNSGTDYPPILESWAKFEAEGRKLPKIIISPHEYPALSAAMGIAQLTGQPQAVFVHVDAGTQNLGGALHNAYRSRVPVYVFAGLSPYTIEGELKGTRNHPVMFIQDVGNQADIVSCYTKANYELKSSKNVKQLVWRALQMSRSDPKSPVYTVASREILGEESCNVTADQKNWAPVVPSGLSDESIEEVMKALLGASRPVIITSCIGQNIDAVDELVRFSQTLAIPVVETNRSVVNFPGDNEMHLGFDSPSVLQDADVALVIDSDVPWIPASFKPNQNCRVFYIDVDPLKENIPVWYIPSERFMKADACTALRQLSRKLAENPDLVDRDTVEQRRKKVAAKHHALREKWRQEEATEGMTAAFVTTCLREVIDEDTILLNELTSFRPALEKFVPRTKPGTLFTSGGGSLGWFGGAAIGMKLARPEKDIVALTGDGTFIFSNPTAVYWMARKYNTPFMTVIFNNRGWNAPKASTVSEYPGGYAEKRNSFYASFDPPAQLDNVAAAAGGAFARTVTEPAELKDALLAGRAAVKNGTCAVINVMMKPV